MARPRKPAAKKPATRAARKPTQPGGFKKGADPRRHVLSEEDRAKAFESKRRNAVERRMDWTDKVGARLIAALEERGIKAPDKTKLDEIVDTMVEKAIAGDERGLLAVIDSALGKAPQPVDITGSGADGGIIEIRMNIG